MTRAEDNLVDKSHIISCILYLKEASQCIESEHEDISLAILELAKAIADLHSTSESQEAKLQEIADEIRRA